MYENTPESLEEMGRIINVFIDNLPIKREEILEVCVNVAERVRPLEGSAYNMFNFLEEPLAEKLTELLELPVCIENDTRSMTYAEFIKGQLQRPERRHLRERMLGHRNRNHHRRQTLLRQVGIFWRIRSHDCLQQQHHLPLRQDWLHRNRSFGQSTQKETHREDKGRKDYPSSLTRVLKKNEDLSLQDILDAIAKEDVLSLATLQRIADELGKQLAGVINIFNPEMLVIGGEMSVTGDYLTLPVKMGIKKFSLNIMNEDSKIVTSSLKGLAGITGACLMARYRLLNENIDK